MRSLPALLLSLACFSLGSAAVGQDAPPAEDALRRPAAGFALPAVPEGWSLQEQGEPGSGYALVLAPAEGGGAAQFTLRIAPNTAPEDPSDYCATLVANLSGQEQHSGIERIERQIAGRAAPGVELLTRAEGVEYRARHYALVGNGYRYTLQEHAPAEQFAEFTPGFTPFFDGFALIPLEGEAAEDQQLRALAARCGSEWDWAPDWKTAAARAREQGKLVLLYARFYPGFEMSDAVISGPLMDEEVVALGRAHFVPLRLSRATEAPFRSAEVYGMGGSTFGQAVLVAHPDGRILAADSHLQSFTLEAALRRGLAAGDIELPAEAPPSDGARSALQLAKAHRRAMNGEAALRELARAGAAVGAEEHELRDLIAVVRATVLIGMDRSTDAEALLRELIAARPASSHVAEARFLLGACRFQAADGDGARAAWLGLTRDRPDSRWAWQAAAFLQSTFFEAGLGADLSWPDPERVAAVAWKPAAPLPLAEAQRAEAGAMAWLLRSQREDGSWGSPSELSRMRHVTDDVFSIAHTALAGSALLPYREQHPPAGAAAERALAFLFAARERELLRTPPVFYMDYTPWSKAAELGFLLDCVDAGVGDETALLELAAALADELAGKQKPGGGWSYYLSGSLEGAARPAPQSISFTTAYVLHALLRAEQAGVELPPAVTRAGLDCLEAMRNPNGTFEYMTSPGQAPRETGNGRPGAAGRGPVCSTALVAGGRETLEDLRERLDIAMEHLEELSREQGKGLMHAGREAQGSHYLMFDYATCAAAVARLPAEQRVAYRGPLLEAILNARYQDGSFTDNPIIGPAAGTALALAAFHRLRPLP